MSVMLFKLRGVEEDEADDIRTLLNDADIEFYETNNGRWGLGFAAIWLHDHVYSEQATTLIDAYQKQRAVEARADYVQLCAEGKQPTLWKRLKARPMQVVLAMLAIAIVSLFALTPFVFF